MMPNQIVTPYLGYLYGNIGYYYKLILKKNYAYNNINLEIIIKTTNMEEKKLL